MIPRKLAPLASVLCLFASASYGYWPPSPWGDCNANGIVDSLEIEATRVNGESFLDCDNDGRIDECESNRAILLPGDPDVFLTTVAPSVSDEAHFPRASRDIDVQLEATTLSFWFRTPQALNGTPQIQNDEDPEDPSWHPLVWWGRQSDTATSGTLQVAGVWINSAGRVAATIQGTPRSPAALSALPVAAISAQNGLTVTPCPNLAHIRDTRWHHIAITASRASGTASNNSFNLYIDGILSASQSGLSQSWLNPSDNYAQTADTLAAFGPTILNVGGLAADLPNVLGFESEDQVTQSALSFEIDELRAWSAATPGYLLDHRTQNFIQSDLNLLGWWSLDEPEWGSQNAPWSNVALDRHNLNPLWLRSNAANLLAPQRVYAVASDWTDYGCGINQTWQYHNDRPPCLSQDFQASPRESEREFDYYLDYAFVDCNENGISDFTDQALTGLVPECLEAADPAFDCNANGFEDEAEVSALPRLDLDGNEIIDQCQIDRSLELGTGDSATISERGMRLRTLNNLYNKEVVTLGFWFKMTEPRDTSNSANKWSILLHKGLDASNGHVPQYHERQWGLWLNQSGVLALTGATDGASTYQEDYCVSSAQTSLLNAWNEWHYVVATIDRRSAERKMTLYLDGTQIAQTTNIRAGDIRGKTRQRSWNVPMPTILQVGGLSPEAPGSGVIYKALRFQIDEFQIFELAAYQNVELLEEQYTLAEAMRYYSPELASHAALRGYWSFDEPYYIAKAQDNSNNRNTLLPQGQPIPTSSAYPMPRRLGRHNSTGYSLKSALGHDIQGPYDPDWDEDGDVSNRASEDKLREDILWDTHHPIVGLTPWTGRDIRKTSPSDQIPVAGGNFLVASKEGLIHAYLGERIQTIPVLDLRKEVNSIQDRGLLGLTVHPTYRPDKSSIELSSTANFTPRDSSWVYAFYTAEPDAVSDDPSCEACDDGGCGVETPWNPIGEYGVGRLRRFRTYWNADGNVVAYTPDLGETSHVLIDNIPLLYESHTMDSLHFGSDDTLIASLGETSNFNVSDFGGIDLSAFKKNSGRNGAVGIYDGLEGTVTELDGMDTFTLQTWYASFMDDDEITTGQSTILHQGVTSPGFTTSDKLWTLAIREDNSTSRTVEVSILDENQQELVVSVTPLPLDYGTRFDLPWEHLTVIADRLSNGNKRLRVYHINGEGRLAFSSADQPMDGAWGSADTEESVGFRIGSTVCGLDQWIGLVDDLRFWSTPLDEAIAMREGAVSTNCQPTPAMRDFPPKDRENRASGHEWDLLAYWRFDDPAASPVFTSQALRGMEEPAAISMRNRHDLFAMGYELTFLTTSGTNCLASFEGLWYYGWGRNAYRGPFANTYPDLPIYFEDFEDSGALRAQEMRSLNGKILRIDPKDGSGITAANAQGRTVNPLVGAASQWTSTNNPWAVGGGDPRYNAWNAEYAWKPEWRANVDRIWAMGFRNPFRMSIHPDNTTKLATPHSTGFTHTHPGYIYVGDVGGYKMEEVSVVDPRIGINYGWPLREGLAKNDYSSYNRLTDFQTTVADQVKAPGMIPLMALRQPDSRLWQDEEFQTLFGFSGDPNGAPPAAGLVAPLLAYAHPGFEGEAASLNQGLVGYAVMGGIHYRVSSEFPQQGGHLYGVEGTGPQSPFNYAGKYFFSEYAYPSWRCAIDVPTTFSGNVETISLSTGREIARSIVDQPPIASITDSKQDLLTGEIYMAAAGVGVSKYRFGPAKPDAIIGTIPPYNPEFSQIRPERGFWEGIPTSITLTGGASTGVGLTYEWWLRQVIEADGSAFPLPQGDPRGVLLEGAAENYVVEIDNQLNASRTYIIDLYVTGDGALVDRASITVSPSLVKPMPSIMRAVPGGTQGETERIPDVMFLAESNFKYRAFGSATLRDGITPFNDPEDEEAVPIYFDWLGITNHRNAGQHNHGGAASCSEQLDIENGIALAAHGAGLYQFDTPERFWTDILLSTSTIPTELRNEPEVMGANATGIPFFEWDVRHAYTDRMTPDQWQSDKLVRLQLKEAIYGTTRDFHIPYRAAGLITAAARQPDQYGHEYDVDPGTIDTTQMNGAWFQVDLPPAADLPVGSVLSITWKHQAIGEDQSAFLAINPPHGLLGRYSSGLNRQGFGEGLANGFAEGLMEPYDERPQTSYGGFLLFRREEKLDFDLDTDSQPHPYLSGATAGEADMLAEWTGTMDLTGYTLSSGPDPFLFQFYVYCDNGAQVWLDQTAIEVASEYDNDVPENSSDILKPWPTAIDLQGIPHNGPTLSGVLLDNFQDDGRQLPSELIVPFRIRYYRHRNSDGVFQLRWKPPGYMGDPVPVPAEVFRAGFDHLERPGADQYLTKTTGTDNELTITHTVRDDGNQDSEDNEKKLYIWVGADLEVDTNLEQELAITVQSVPAPLMGLQSFSSGGSQGGSTAPSGSTGGGGLPLPLHFGRIRQMHHHSGSSSNQGDALQALQVSPQCAPYLVEE